MASASIPAEHSFPLRIDGVDVVGEQGQSVLQVAQENGIEIPTLCYLEGLSAWGGCRLCLVEVAGVARLLPACTTAVSANMEIQTNTERLQYYRKVILEMLFSERNHLCSVCVSNGHCELQSLGQDHGIDHVHLPYRYPSLSVDATHERFQKDHNRCILCTRCVRVCAEIEGAHTKGVGGRGIQSLIIEDLNQPWGDSQTCTSCGKCVQVCPTGALAEKGKSVAEMVKHYEFLPYLTSMREDRQ
jgi:bidirectional [NiFe] hydrogenase diaphorase subunit